MPTIKIITPADKEAAKQAIDALREGKRFDVKIKAYVPKRSVPQNRTYWMWVNCIHDETGNDQNDIHDELREMFLGYVVREVFGRPQDKLRSTTTLTTVEFSVYLEKVQAFAASELGIRLPQPEERAWLEFYDMYGNE